MSEKELLFMDNIIETVSSISDTKDILNKNEITRKYVEDYDNFFRQYSEKLPFKDADDFENIMLNYERCIQVSSFLIGFQIGIKSLKLLESDDFVSNIINKLM